MVDKLGPRLREAREAKGATLQDAETATHIRAHFLDSLEAGDFATFRGGDVQVRGFLRIYARYLDISPDDVIRRYSVEVDGENHAFTEPVEGEAPPQPSEPPEDLASVRFRPRNIPMGSSLPPWMSVKTVIIFGIVLTVLLGILALATYVMNQPDGGQLLGPLTGSGPTQTPQMSRALTATAILIADLLPTLPANSKDDVTVALEATEQVQVRVRRGDDILFQEMMVPGQVETWTETETITVETGNGTAVRVTVNRAQLGMLCDERGELCTRAWDPSGEVTP